MTTSNKRIIIVGAGASGLYAARALAKEGYQILIVEARDRVGGRINTIKPKGFFTNIEAGAEFIHGKGDTISGLIKEASLKSIKVEGEIWRKKNNELDLAEDFIEDDEILIKELKALKEDTSVKNFIDQRFSGSTHQELKDSVIKYVEGYDAADTSKASAFALCEEWMQAKDMEQYRCEGGYIELISFLEKECIEAGCTFHLSSPVHTIRWKQNHVEVIGNNIEISAEKAIITIPLGILQLPTESDGAIQFSPALADKRAAAKAMGFGPVIKISLQFDKPFWKMDPVKNNTGKDLKELGFLFTNESVPTWWTQLPEESPILTGWISGPNVTNFNTKDDQTILDEAILSLANVFDLPFAEIQAKLTAWHIYNWLTDPFSRGAYSYATVETNHSRKVVAEPVADTLYFAGEALYEEEAGTVEAAFASGKEVAKKIISKK